MKKTFKIKNYMGNLVESLSKFQKKNPSLKICEAFEDENTLKITAEDSKSDIELKSEKMWDEASKWMHQTKEAFNVFKQVVELSKKALEFDEQNNLVGSYQLSNTKADIKSQEEALDRIKSSFGDVMAY